MDLTINMVIHSDNFMDLCKNKTTNEKFVCDVLHHSEKLFKCNQYTLIGSQSNAEADLTDNSKQYPDLDIKTLFPKEIRKKYSGNLSNNIQQIDQFNQFNLLDVTSSKPNGDLETLEQIKDSIGRAIKHEKTVIIFYPIVITALRYSSSSSSGLMSQLALSQCPPDPVIQWIKELQKELNLESLYFLAPVWNSYFLLLHSQLEPIDQYELINDKGIHADFFEFIGVK